MGNIEAVVNIPKNISINSTTYVCITTISNILKNEDIVPNTPNRVSTINIIVLTLLSKWLQDTLILFFMVKPLSIDCVSILEAFRLLLLITFSLFNIFAPPYTINSPILSNILPLTTCTI